MTMKPIWPRFRWCSICTDDENNDSSHIPASTTEPHNAPRRPITRTEQRPQQKVVPSPASSTRSTTLRPQSYAHHHSHEGKYTFVSRTAPDEITGPGQ